MLHPGHARGGRSPHRFLGRIGDRWIHFFLSFTVELLLFLAVDGFHESLEIAGPVPEAFQGIGLVVIFATAMLTVA